MLGASTLLINGATIGDGNLFRVILYIDLVIGAIVLLSFCFTRILKKIL
jgi:hypothetical protein